MTILVGAIGLDVPAILAPMSGVTDLPFRRIARRFGAGLVVSEMVASEEFVRGRAEDRRRASSDDEVAPVVVQLAGREAHWLGEAARIAEAGGAAIVDINMGCPSKKVTSGLCGSALMRDLDQASRLIEAVVGAVSVPVTLKMRLGWDAATVNSPELARRAEAIGVQMITVHGRTRCQFYEGHADWSAIRAVKDAVRVPVVVNGDIDSIEDAREALSRSGADAVMIGRASLGRPWLVGRIGAALAGDTRAEPDAAIRWQIVREHVEESLRLYGTHLGTRVVRKHLAAYMQHEGLAAADRSALCRLDDPHAVLRAIDAVYAPIIGGAERLAA